MFVLLFSRHITLLRSASLYGSRTLLLGTGCSFIAFVAREKVIVPSHASLEFVFRVPLVQPANCTCMHRDKNAGGQSMSVHSLMHDQFIFRTLVPHKMNQRISMFSLESADDPAIPCLRVKRSNDKLKLVTVSVIPCFHLLMTVQCGFKNGFESC